MNYTSNIKDVKEYKLAKSVMYNFVLSIFITLALSVIAIYAFGLKLDIVLSDSMVPVFAEHDIVVLMSCDDYEVGDIIEYNLNKYTKPVTHRIIEKEGTGKSAIYKTEGDNVENGLIDVIGFDQVNGKVIGILYDGEHIYDFIKSNYFLLIDIVLGTWVLTSIISSESEMNKHNIAKAQ